MAEVNEVILYSAAAALSGAVTYYLYYNVGAEVGLVSFAFSVLVVVSLANKVRDLIYAVKYP